MSDQTKPMLPGLPTLPQPLLDAIGEYGLARTDGVSEIERVHRWEVLISLVKDYAGAIQLATWKVAMEYAAGLCDEQEALSRSAADRTSGSTASNIYHHCATTARWCGEAIRQAPEPGEGG